MLGLAVLALVCVMGRSSCSPNDQTAEWASEPGPRAPSSPSTTATARDPRVALPPEGSIHFEDEALPPSETAALDPWRTREPRTRTPAWVFENKYFGQLHSPDDAERVAQAVADTLETMRFQALKARFDMGAFAVRPMQAGEGIGGTYGYKLRRGPDDPLAMLSTTQDGQAARIAWLPFDEYPEVYELADEYQWLVDTVSELRVARGETWSEERPGLKVTSTPPGG